MYPKYSGWWGLVVVLALAAAWQAWRQAAHAEPQPEQSSADDTAAVDVRSFGARGDGAADDTPAIQAAVDHGGCVDLPRGVYRITKPIEIRLERTGYTSLNGHGVAQLAMEGAGPAIRFVGTHDGTADPLTFHERVWRRERTPAVNGLEIIGRHAEASGIEANGTMQLTLSQLALRKLLHGVHLTGRNRNALISDCHIYENRGIGIYYDNVNLHQSNINGCHISYCSGGGVVVRGGDVRNIHVNGCDIEGNQTLDGEPTANVLIDCRGGSTAEIAIVGCTIQHGAKAPGSANIRMLGASHYLSGQKKLAARWGNLTIADNVLSDVETNIDLRGVRGATISGNTIWQGAKFNLRLVDCEQLSIGGNVCERNPPYDYAGLTANAVLLERCSDIVLASNQFHGIAADAGVQLSQCHRVNVTGCNIVDCTGVELRLKDAKHCRVSDCLLRDDRPDVGEGALVLQCNDGEGNQITDNLLSGRYELGRDAAVEEGNQTVP